MVGGFIICAIVGHRWTQPAEVHEAYPLFICERCGRTQEFSSETHGLDKTALKGDMQQKVPQSGRRL